jgi:hypothetical protein
MTKTVQQGEPTTDAMIAVNHPPLMFGDGAKFEKL